jgi:hypothetical protein
MAEVVTGTETLRRANSRSRVGFVPTISKPSRDHGIVEWLDEAPANALSYPPDLPAFVPRTTGRESRSDGNGWSIESAWQEPDSGITAGSEIDPEITLKLETPVRTPLGPPNHQRNATASPSGKRSGNILATVIHLAAHTSCLPPPISARWPY